MTVGTPISGGTLSRYIEGLMLPAIVLGDTTHKYRIPADVLKDPFFYTNFNPDDKTDNMTLSNSDLTVTSSDTSTIGHVRVVDGWRGGNFYVEFFVDTLGTARTEVGVTVNGPAIDIGRLRFAYNSDGNGSIYDYNLSVLHQLDLEPWAEGDYIGFYIDTVNRNLWCRRNNGIWNGNADALPNGDHRQDFSSIDFGDPKMLDVVLGGSGGTTSVITLNAGSLPWNQPIPATGGATGWRVFSDTYVLGDLIGYGAINMNQMYLQGLNNSLQVYMQQGDRNSLHTSSPTLAVNGNSNDGIGLGLYPTGLNSSFFDMAGWATPADFSFWRGLNYFGDKHDVEDGTEIGVINYKFWHSSDWHTAGFISVRMDTASAGTASVVIGAGPTGLGISVNSAGDLTIDGTIVNFSDILMNADLSGLPTTDPGGGKPWLSSGVLKVGT